MSQEIVHTYDKFPFPKWSRSDSRKVEEATQELKEMLGKASEVSARVITG